MLGTHVRIGTVQRRTMEKHGVKVEHLTAIEGGIAYNSRRPIYVIVMADPSLYRVGTRSPSPKMVRRL